MIKLLAVRDDGHSYPVAFSTARQALDFAARKAADTELAETEDRYLAVAHPGTLDEDELALAELLNPSCHHGLSAGLCLDPDGPNHWGSVYDDMKDEVPA